MAWWQTVALTSLVTTIITIIIGEPLKQWVAKRLNKKQGEKDKLIRYIRDHKGVEILTTEELQRSILPRKTIGYVYELLQELKREGQCKSAVNMDTEIENAGWYFKLT